ncbi:TPA: hypothetical protein U1B91_000244 [Streptococcus suis]|nr:hypothetical protein [Streptococcus suis]
MSIKYLASAKEMVGLSEHEFQPGEDFLSKYLIASCLDIVINLSPPRIHSDSDCTSSLYHQSTNMDHISDSHKHSPKYIRNYRMYLSDLRIYPYAIS